MQADVAEPEGLNSGAAIPLMTIFLLTALLSYRRSTTMCSVDLAYLIADTAKDIAKRDGKYQNCLSK